MITVTNIALAVMTLSGLLCLARLLRGGSLADRIIALDTLLVVIVSGVGILSARNNSAVFLDMIVLAALLGFVGTITVARYIENRGAR